MTLNRALKRLKARFPSGRYFQTGEISAGRTEDESEDQYFHLVSIYEHAITNSFLSIDSHNFVISNGFVGSHAYNLALVCYHHTRKENYNIQWFRNALRHNFKKFFSECVLGEKNCLIGRAFLLETLVHEQDLMKRIFDSLPSDPKTAQIAQELSTVMTSLISSHEMAHYFIERTGGSIVKEIQKMCGIDLDDWLTEIKNKNGGAFAEEIECDLFAIIHFSCDDSTNDLTHFKDLASRLNLGAYHLEVFSHFNALYESGRQTAVNSLESDSAIKLGSEKRTLGKFDFMFGRNGDIDKRREIILPILHRLAEREGMSLFSPTSAFSFDEKMSQEIRQAWETCLEPIEPINGTMTGTDLHRRGLCQLISESLHGHDQGAEHLLWRSKNLSVGGENIDP